MRKTFIGYYTPTREEFSALWEDCLFVPDASVLLNLYRYSQAARDELLGIFTQVADRLWVPHQAAWEYQQRRLEVIAEQMESHRKIEVLLTNNASQLENSLRQLRHHPQIDLDGIIRKIRRTYGSIRRDLAKLQKECPDLKQQDDVRDRLTLLLDGKVGPPYTPERLEEIARLGKLRSEKEIPPGYKTTAPPTGPYIGPYGGFVLWQQVLDKAREAVKPVILITDNDAQDWWLKPGGEAIGPRPELIEEAMREAQVFFYMYQSDPFMEQARFFLKRPVKQEAIEEVRSVRQQDEQQVSHEPLEVGILLPSSTSDTLFVDIPDTPFPLELVRVPAGEFLMGSDAGRDRYADSGEQPQQRVFVSEFYISRYPIVNAQFAALDRVHLIHFDFPTGKDNHPVSHVSWSDAVTFCQWIGKVSRLDMRLPTEAEWEKAARGMDGRIYPWGDVWDTSLANTEEGALRETTPVGKYSPASDSPYGVADMAGNVWEWTSSLFKPYPYQADDGRENPRSPSPRVLRGGSWGDSQISARAACRYGYDPFTRHHNVGFRVALSL